jgi:A/G-specific adenine glycosylase
MRCLTRLLYVSGYGSRAGPEPKDIYVASLCGIYLLHTAVIMKISKGQVQRFRQRVYQAYGLYGRHTLPWRTTNNPYHILVSEVMLQQTQVARVLQKYPEFIRTFPTLQTLAKAPFKKVVAVWDGLGYNRRCLNLHKTAKLILKEHKGKVPNDITILASLPGIGHATACEIAAFAYGMAHPFIETNIRSVYLYHFFRKRRSVHDRELMPLIEATLDIRSAREWFYALMDYGVHLKQSQSNPSRRSTHHVKQPRFEGSDRQARGKLLRAIARRSMSLASLSTSADIGKDKAERLLVQMIREGLISRSGGRYRIAR